MYFDIYADTCGQKKIVKQIGCKQDIRSEKIIPFRYFAKL